VLFKTVQISALGAGRWALSAGSPMPGRWIPAVQLLSKLQSASRQANE